MCDSFWGFLLYVCKANAIAEFLLPFRRHAEHTLYTQSFKVHSWNISYAKGHKKLKKKETKNVSETTEELENGNANNATSRGPNGAPQSTFAACISGWFSLQITFFTVEATDCENQDP